MDTKFRGQQKPTRRLTDCHEMFQQEEAPRRMFLCVAPLFCWTGGSLSTGLDGPIAWPFHCDVPVSGVFTFGC
jgi:hypothetical protein